MLFQSDNAKVRQLSLPLTIVAVVITLFGVGWYGWATLGPPPPPKADLPERPYLEEKARECAGDFAKLSKEDQNKVNKLTHNMGGMAMAKAFQSLSGSKKL